MPALPAALTRLSCHTGPVSNLTVVLDDDVLRKARLRALQEGTSMDAVVREMISAYARGDQEEDTAVLWLAEHARHSRATSGPDGRTWSRDELYGPVPD